MFTLYLSHDTCTLMVDQYRCTPQVATICSLSDYVSSIQSTSSQCQQAIVKTVILLANHPVHQVHKLKVIRILKLLFQYFLHQVIMKQFVRNRLDLRLKERDPILFLKRGRCTMIGKKGSGYRPVLGNQTLPRSGFKVKRTKLRLSYIREWREKFGIDGSGNYKEEKS